MQKKSGPELISRKMPEVIEQLVWALPSSNVQKGKSQSEIIKFNLENFKEDVKEQMFKIDMSIIDQLSERKKK